MQLIDQNPAEQILHHAGMSVVINPDLKADLLSPETQAEFQAALTRLPPEESARELAALAELTALLNRVSSSAATVAAPTTTRTVSSKGATKVATAAPEYVFPSEDQTFLDFLACQDSHTPDELLQALEELILPITKAPEAYPAVRAKVCALEIMLNNMQYRLPCSRPRIQVPNATGLTDEQHLVSNDLQVIDLHWLWAMKHQVATEKWGRIFGPEFKYLLASAFVAKVGRSTNKRDELGLIRTDMLQLRVLRDDSSRLRQKDIVKLMDQARSRIREGLSAPRSRAQCDVLEMVQTCHSLLLADLDVTKAIHVAELQYRLTIDTTTMTRRKGWLMKRKCIHKLA